MFVSSGPGLETDSCVEESPRENFAAFWLSFPKVQARRVIIGKDRFETHAWDKRLRAQTSSAALVADHAVHDRTAADQENVRRRHEDPCRRSYEADRESGVPLPRFRQPAKEMTRPRSTTKVRNKNECCVLVHVPRVPGTEGEPRVPRPVPRGRRGQ